MVQRRRGSAALSAALVPLLTAAVWTLTAPAYADSVPGQPDACVQADALTALGDPDGAIESIEALRKASPPDSGPARTCAVEYAEAVARRTAAVRLVQWADRLEEAAAATEGDLVTVPSPVPEPCEGDPPTDDSTLATSEVSTVAATAREQARACDSGNEAAAAAPELTLAESSKSSWEEFRSSRLDPWVPVVIALLVWAAGVLVLARALLWVPRWRGNGLAVQMTRRPWTRRAALTVGWGALAVSGALATGLASLVQPGHGFRPSGLVVLIVAQLVLAALLVGVLRRRLLLTSGLVALGLLLLGLSMRLEWIDAHLAGPLVPQVWEGAAAAAVAAFALAAAWAAGNSLMISPQGEGAPSLDYVQALAKQLGIGPPRGLEIPVGTDTQLLASIGISETPSNPVVAAAVRVAKLARPPAPWQMVVTAHTTETWSVELSRNHRVVKSETLARAALFRALEGANGSAGDVRSELDLAPFAAALAVVSIALAQDDHPPGLAGATRWQAVGLQYLGSLRPRGDAAARPLFASAVAEDPDNRLAQASYWNSLYRDATDVEDLSRYRSLLDGALCSLDSREQFLKVRLRYSRVAVGINLSSLGEPDHALERKARQLLADVDGLPPDVADFKRSMQRNALALVLSVSDELLPSTAETLPADDRAPEENGPSVNYSLGCYYATAPRGATGPRDAARAVRHLRLADADPALAEWRGLDPQIRAFRDSSPYRTAFGLPVPTDVLSVSPFTGHAAQLRAAGLVTLELLGRTTDGDLWQLGLRGPAARWLRQMVELGLALSDTPLRPWRVPIVATFAERGYSAIPARADERAALQQAILDACACLRSGPTQRQVAAWFCLGLRPGWAVAEGGSAH